MDEKVLLNVLWLGRLEREGRFGNVLCGRGRFGNVLCGRGRFGNESSNLFCINLREFFSDNLDEG